MASLILKRRSSDMNKLLFHNPLLRSVTASASAAAAAPPSDRLLPAIGARRLSDALQTRSFSQMMMGGLIKSNPIAKNASQLLNDAKQLKTMSMPAGLGLAALRRYSTKSVRPLSPHLSTYKPQSSSMGSIFHRISFMYISGLIAFYYLVYIKMGAICLTYDSFNTVLFYTSKLNTILFELSWVAAFYYFYHGLEQFVRFRSGGLMKMLRFGKK